MSRMKLAIAAAMKAKKAWDRLPPEQRQKLAETAKAQGAAAARKAAEAARTHGPVVAKRVSDAVERVRKPGDN